MMPSRWQIRVIGGFGPRRTTFSSTVEVLGFLVNLGQTGAWTVLTDKSFIVKNIFKDSPTVVDPLKLDHEIIGVFGKSFTAYQCEVGRGYECPIMGLGGSVAKAPRWSRGLPFNSSNIKSKKEL
jgi:hypothetical protein